MNLNNNGMEKALWSVAIPGFGQLLNKKYFKGLILIILEFLINVNSNLNMVIILSFNRRMENAVEQTNYSWLMFYPCIYSFAIWDAYKDGQQAVAPLSYMPSAFSAFTGTIGVVYSSNFRFFGVLLGPVFLPSFSALLGFILGYLLRKLLIKHHKNHAYN